MEKEKPEHFKHQEKLDEKILQEIIESAQLEMGSGTEAEIILNYGSKELTINIDREDVKLGREIANIITYLTTKEGQEKKDKETSYLYQAAKIFMQQFANKFNQPLTYILQTFNKKMVAFAETQGKEIFHWEKRYEVERAPEDEAAFFPQEDDFEKKQIFHKIFNPKNEK